MPSKGEAMMLAMLMRPKATSANTSARVIQSTFWAIFFLAPAMDQDSSSWKLSMICS